MTETKVSEFANSVDVREVAHYEPPRLDLRRLPFSLCICHCGDEPIFFNLADVNFIVYVLAPKRFSRLFSRFDIKISCVCSEPKIYVQKVVNNKQLTCVVFPEVEPPGIQINNLTGLIVGLAVGLTLALLLGALIGYYIYRRNRWRIYLKRPLTTEEYVNQEETNFTTAYPVTKQYYKER